MAERLVLLAELVSVEEMAFLLVEKGGRWFAHRRQLFVSNVLALRLLLCKTFSSVAPKELVDFPSSAILLTSHCAAGSRPRTEAPFPPSLSTPALLPEDGVQVVLHREPNRLRRVLQGSTWSTLGALRAHLVWEPS